MKFLPETELNCTNCGEKHTMLEKLECLEDESYKTHSKAHEICTHLYYEKSYPMENIFKKKIGNANLATLLEYIFDNPHGVLTQEIQFLIKEYSIPKIPSIDFLQKFLVVRDDIIYHKQNITLEIEQTLETFDFENLFT